MTNIDQLRWKLMQKDPFWHFWATLTLLWTWENDLRKFEIHKNGYKVHLRIDSFEIFYGGDRMKIKYIEKITNIAKRVASTMIFPPTSEINHYHKVTNITMSPTSLSPVYCWEDDSNGKTAILSEHINLSHYELHPREFRWSNYRTFKVWNISLCLETGHGINISIQSFPNQFL